MDLTKAYTKSIKKLTRTKFQFGVFTSGSWLLWSYFFDVNLNVFNICYYVTGSSENDKQILNYVL